MHHSSCHDRCACSMACRARAYGARAGSVSTPRPAWQRPARPHRSRTGTPVRMQPALTPPGALILGVETPNPPGRNFYAKDLCSGAAWGQLQFSTTQCLLAGDGLGRRTVEVRTEGTLRRGIGSHGLSAAGVPAVRSSSCSVIGFSRPQRIRAQP